MHLRFPLPAGYFPKFELTPDETMAFQSLVTDIVKETRRDQLHYVRDGKMSIDSRTWKLAKSKERLHVYRRRSANGPGQLGLYGAAGTNESMSSLSRSGSESSVDDLSRRMASASVSSSNRGSFSYDDVSRKSIAPSVLGFGLIEGSVDDIIYGLHESSTEEMKTMASFLGDDSLIDCAVLHTLRLTKSTYLGLKWKLTRSLGGNRDVCFAEYVGIAVDSHGERYGFHVLESVPVGNCPPFADNSIVRTNMSFCYLFRESSQPGLVDVFMEGAFDSTADALTAGGVGDNRSAMEMLFGLDTAFQAAEAKKLSSLVALMASQPKAKASSTHCSICRAKPGLLSSHLTCQGCGCVICTKCRVKKQTFSRKGKIKVSCCKICLVNVKDTSPFEGVTFEKQPLQALQKKKSAASLSNAPSRPPLSGGHTESHQQKLLQRHNSNGSAAETEYSQSMQSWPSSSVSSTYSDLDDQSYYPTLQQTPEEHGSQMVLMDRKRMAAADAGPGYGFQQRSQHQPPQQQQQLARYGSQNQLVQSNQHQMHYLPQQQPTTSHMTPLHAGYAPPPQQQQQGYAPQQQHIGGAYSNSNNNNQTRAGLYNQMLELQMAAERAYNMANQNATYMHTTQQHR
uniref:FYVE-type domain-containing protein n=1 Tax=Globisporangium ultimum (strain ATCC 200006 / CBS 805.95 / DAOM BR144) TaxID=431595 RepID=K3W6F0_GLOUD